MKAKRVKRAERRNKEVKLLRLDLGCGKNKKEGFTGVDIYAKEADVKCDLSKPSWPFKDSSVGEVWSSHFLEHLTGAQRVVFMDELFRVMAPGSKATIITPNWSSPRSVQDPTHQWPPIAASSFLYFNKGWREANKLDHYLGSCDFDFSFSYSIDPKWSGRSQEFLQGAVETMLGVAADLTVVLTKRVEVGDV